MSGEWIEGKARGIYGRIFPGEWKDLGNGVLQGRCPGEGSHTVGSGKGDARIHLAYGPNGEKPGCFCLHKSCRGVLDELNRAFRDAIFARDGGGEYGRRLDDGKPGDGVVWRAPREREEWVPEFNVERLNGVTMGVPPVDADWFMRRSPVRPEGMNPGDFLERAFFPGDRVLVFTEFKSQGDFLWEVGSGGFRMGEKKGVRAVRSALPTDGKEQGAWFLCQPVTGQWYPNPRRDGVESRRSEEAVTVWRHLVLECDEEKTFLKRGHALLDAAAARKKGVADAAILEELKQRGGAKWGVKAFEDGEWEDRGEWHLRWAPEIPKMWLKFLAMAPLRISAIYSSGGHSMHALVRADCGSKAEMDTLMRNSVKKTLPLIGADPGALTPVRLTRLPGVTRGGRMQRLIYLNPRPEATAAGGRPILDLAPVR